MSIIAGLWDFLIGSIVGASAAYFVKRVKRLKVSKGESCKTCYYWEKSSLSANYERECRKRAPIPGVNPVTFYSAIWPITSEIEWCGEWKGPKDINLSNSKT